MVEVSALAAVSEMLGGVAGGSGAGVVMVLSIRTGSGL
jgi:hypothetical protein